MRKKHIKIFLAGIAIFGIVLYPIYPIALAIAQEEQNDVEVVQDDTNDEVQDSAGGTEESGSETDPDGSGEETGDENSAQGGAEELRVDEETDGQSGTETRDGPEADEQGGAEFEDKTKTEDVQSETEEPQGGFGNDEGTREEDAEDSTIENNNDVKSENEASSASDTGNNNIEEENTPEDNLETFDEEADKTRASDSGEDHGEEEDDDNEDAQEQGDEKEEKGEEEDDGTNVETGDAGSSASVVNDVNANIVTQNGERLAEVVKNYEGDINLLEYLYNILKNATSQNLGSLEIINDNKAVIENNVSAEANTGKNSLASDEANIITGDASAEASAVNYVNQNIIGNNWLFAAITILGSWIGDLVVPGEGVIRMSDVQGYEEVDISGNNEAEIENGVDVQSSTRENEIEGEGEIRTGSAASAANVSNMVNTNIVKDNWFYLLINNMGIWNGLALNWDDKSASLEYGYDFEVDPDSAVLKPEGKLLIENNNEAEIKNNVSAKSNTGGNELGRSGFIQTGNAESRANIFNFVNSNIVGNNWFFGMVNVMGNWKGNLVFGYPDLDVAISGVDSAKPGDEITYQIHYKNIGRANAEDVRLEADFPEEAEIISSPDSFSGRKLVLDAGEVKSGEEKMIEVKTVIDGSMEEKKSISVQAVVSAGNAEKELGNNKDFLSTEIGVLETDSPEDYHSNGWEEDDFSPGLKIKRSVNNSGTVKSGDLVKHSIIIENSGDTPVYEITLTDKIKNSSGEEMGKFVQWIGDLDAGKKVLLEYMLEVNDPGEDLRIANVARAEGKDPFDERVKSKKSSVWLSLLGSPAMAADASAIDLQAEALAASAGEAEVLGFEGFENASAKRKLPLWMWFLSAAAYFLAINWSFFPKLK